MFLALLLSTFADDKLIVRIEQRTPQLVAALAALPPHRETPLFRVPPRGWRDPAAALACGLEEFVTLRFAAPRGDLELLARSLSHEPGVVRCERVAQGEAGSTTPDDPDFASQWALQPGFLDCPDAWDRVTRSNQLVAVIDSGCDITHPELQASIWSNPGEIPGNGIDDEGNGYVDDVHGWNFVLDTNDISPAIPHGTRVNGAIAAEGDNALEIAGICWSAPLLQALVWGISFDPIDVDNASAALVYAADQGARVAQMAWGFFAPEPMVLRAAVAYAKALDVVQVSLAGNFAITDPLYPAASPDVLGLIATDNLDRRAVFSSWGPWCDLSAPGVSIYSISIPGQPRTSAGTTFASAHTSGCAALLREWVPDADEETIRLLLIQSAKDLGTPGFDSDFGWGRIDLGAAMRLATTLRPDRYVIAPGDDLVLTIDDPAAPNRFHAIVPGRFGRQPGTPNAELDPADPRTLFVNEDLLLWPIALSCDPNAFFDRFLECTDANGFSQATMHVPAGPALLGTELCFSAALFDPADLDHVERITATTRVRVR
jgi:hypothetical protein